MNCHCLRFLLACSAVCATASLAADELRQPDLFTAALQDQPPNPNGQQPPRLPPTDVTATPPTAPTTPPGNASDGTDSVGRNSLETGGTESTVDAERIQRNISRGLDDIFRYEPGVQVNRSTGRFGINDINIRGLGGNRVLMSVDGIRSPDAYQQGPIQLGRDSIDPSLVQQVDIFRGPGSLIYGEGGLGGVVAFETKDPSDFLNVFGNDSYYAARATHYTGDVSFGETFTVAQRFGQWEAMVAYTHRDGHDLESQGSFPSDFQRWDSEYMLGKLVYNFNPNSRLIFATEWLYDDVRTRLDSTLGITVGIVPPIPPPAFFPIDRVASHAQDDSRRIRYSLTHEFDDPDPNAFLQYARAQIYFQDYRIVDSRLQRFETLGFPFAADILNPSANTFAQDMLGGRWLGIGEFVDQADRFHRVTFGFDALRTDSVRLNTGDMINTTFGGLSSGTNQIGEPSPAKVLPDITTIRVGLFVQDEIDVGYGVFLTPGVRVNYYNQDVKVDSLFDPTNAVIPQDISEWSAEPVIGLTVPLFERLDGLVRYAHGYRAPPVEDAAIGFTNPAFGYTILPNPDLKSEQSDGVNVGLSYYGDRLVGYVGGYYTHYDDFIENVTLPPAGGLLRFQQQNLEAQIYGVELAGEWLTSGYFDQGQWTGWSIFGNFTHSVGDNLDDGVPLDSIPPIYSVLGLRYRGPQNAWGGELLTTLVHRKDRPSGTVDNQFITPGYAVVDLLTWWNLSENVQLNLGVYNLFNKEYYEWLSLRGVTNAQADRTRFAGPGIALAGSVGIQW